MFTTLPGASFFLPPATDRDEADAGNLTRHFLAEQEEAGLDLLTAGPASLEEHVWSLARGLGGFTVGAPVGYPGTGASVPQPRTLTEPTWSGPITVAAWEFAAACTTRPVKQTLLGPYTLGRLADPGEFGRERVTLAAAEALREELRALAAAGCKLIQVDEDGATLIGDDPGERRLFVDAHRRLTDGVDGTHLSLAIRGGNADAAGPETIFDPPYLSYLYDLIAGPDNWRLIAKAPADRGIVCAALDPNGSPSGGVETLVWAARYAASLGGRGLERVGLAPAGGLEPVSLESARAAMRTVVSAARLSGASREELAETLDPRAIDAPWNRRTRIADVDSPDDDSA